MSQGGRTSSGEGTALSRALRGWHSVNRRARASAGEGQVGPGWAYWDAGAGLGQAAHMLVAAHRVEAGLEQAAHTLAAAHWVGAGPEQAAHTLAALDSLGPLSPAVPAY